MLWIDQIVVGREHGLEFRSPYPARMRAMLVDRDVEGDAIKERFRPPHGLRVIKLTKPYPRFMQRFSRNILRTDATRQPPLKIVIT